MENHEDLPQGHQGLPPMPSSLDMSSFQREEIFHLQAELQKRKMEALRLYKPNPAQKEFHECLSSETLVIGGNRSGKSLCTFVEDAWAATGTHPVEGKYPKENGNLVIIGANWKHIGLVVVPYLLKAGAFKIIKDLETGEWRAYNPVTDSDREKEAKPAPPLIPHRLIKSYSWLLKSAGYLNSCELHNGWTIHCFSSEGDPPQGFQADRVHCDEDLSNEAWVPEMQARLADRRGRFCWSAMPHSKNDALLNLFERAEKAEGTEREADIKKFTLRFLDNPHIDPNEKRKMIERWASQGEDVLRQRSEGEFITDSLLVYPSFTPMVHGFDRKNLPNGQIPADWCRYLVVDPGHAVTAVLFGAVPPDEKFLLLYDEMYLRQANAVIFGEELLRKVQGQAFYAFLIDAHGARLTDIGSGRSPQEQYMEQLANLNISSEATGHSFIPGSDNVQAGLHATRVMMHIRENGTTQLRYLLDTMPNFVREIKRYKKKVQYVSGQTVVTDEPNKRGEFHLMDCLRYLCAYNPKYHAPQKSTDIPWWVEWKAKRDKQKLGSAVYLAPASYTEVYYA